MILGSDDFSSKLKNYTATHESAVQGFARRTTELRTKVKRQRAKGIRKSALLVWFALNEAIMGKRVAEKSNPEHFTYPINVPSSFTAHGRKIMNSSQGAPNVEHAGSRIAGKGAAL